MLERGKNCNPKLNKKKWCASYSRCINALAEYQLTGTITLYLAMYGRTYTFPEAFRNSTEAYISHQEKIGIIKKSTINHTMRAVPYYLQYCHENGFMEKEMFSKLPNPHYNRQSRLPSSYSADEVTRLLDSIGFGNPCGIRDYAIILLIARLGLRSGDVANLRFSNIDWQKEIILKMQDLKVILTMFL